MEIYRYIWHGDIGDEFVKKVGYLSARDNKMAEQKVENMLGDKGEIEIIHCIEEHEFKELLERGICQTYEKFY